jgi:hypothetical protein
VYQSDSNTERYGIHISSADLKVRKSYFSEIKSLSLVFFCENEDEMMGWLGAFNHAAGIREFRSSSINYVDTTLRKSWVSQVNYRFETPLHILIEYGDMIFRHCTLSRTMKSSDPLGTALDDAETKVNQAEYSNHSYAHTNPSIPAVFLESVYQPLSMKSSDDLSHLLNDMVIFASLVIEYGCPMNARNNNNETALSLAVKKKNTIIVKLLLLKGAAVESLLSGNVGLGDLEYLKEVIISLVSDNSSGGLDVSDNILGQKSDVLDPKPLLITCEKILEQLHQLNPNRHIVPLHMFHGCTYLRIHFMAQQFT